jgi:thiol-disulfide isomerase/thioredoxin
MIALTASAMLLACGPREEQPGMTTPAGEQQTPPSAAQPRPTGTAAASERRLNTNLAMTRLEGGPVTLQQIEGKALLVNLWATWCGPCRTEVPDLVQLRDEFREAGLTVVGVSLDSPGQEDAVRRFAAQYGINYPIVMDYQARVADELETTVIPATVLIDLQGRITWSHIGIVTRDDPGLREALGSMLGG